MRSLNIMTKPNKIARYGITEKKKAELDQLTNMVLDAQNRVEQLQAVVNSLTEKSQKFQAAFVAADTNRTQSLNNKLLVDSVVQNALVLQYNSDIAQKEIYFSDNRSQELAAQVNKVINMLIYTAEVINKLSNFIIRKKALNPLISDELINMVGAAGKDANNAVALMLVALNTSFASQAVILDSEASLALELLQSTNLYETLNGTTIDGQHLDNYDTCLRELLYKAYDNSQKVYNKAQIANNDTTDELNQSSADLTAAQVELRSLQAALAAATAAAYAS